MFSSSQTNFMLAAKLVIILALVTTVYVTLLISRPVIHEDTTFVVAPKSRDMRAEQVRLFALNEIVRANSHDLPPRSKNMSAKALCKQKSTCAPHNRRYETMLRISPQYKMVNCVVQKSMSTMMTGAMCYLYNETVYEESGRTFDDEFTTRLCKDKNEFYSVNDVRDAYNISYIKTDWSFSMITRDPIDRFVSGYVDRCVRLLQKNGTSQCNGCGLNMTCFIESEYAHLMQISFKRRTRRTMEDAHFFPQVWHCDLNEEMEFYEFIQYSSNAEDRMMPQLHDLMKRQNVPRRSIDFIRNQLYRKSSHSTTGTPAKRFYFSRLMTSPYLLELIVKMFYYDFLYLHYELPPGF